MTGAPEIFGIPTANLALGVAVLALAVSGVSAGVSLWVARRDRADVRIQLRYADYFHAGEKAGPFLSIQAANRGRRPVTLNTYGLAFSDRTTLVFVPYGVTSLPTTLAEGKSYTGFMGLRSVQEGVRSKKARLTAVYFDTEDGRRFGMRIWPLSEWHKRLREGELAPAVTNEDLLDPGAIARRLLRRLPPSTR